MAFTQKNVDISSSIRATIRIRIGPKKFGSDRIRMHHTGSNTYLKGLESVILTCLLSYETFFYSKLVLKNSMACLKRKTHCRKRLETDNTSDEEEELPPPILLPEQPSGLTSPTKRLKVSQKEDEDLPQPFLLPEQSSGLTAPTKRLEVSQR
jgi:hypothetical protein